MLPLITSINDVETFQCSNGQTVIRIQPESNVSATEVRSSNASSTEPTTASGNTLNHTCTSTDDDGHSTDGLNESATRALQESSETASSSEPTSSSGETLDRDAGVNPSNDLLQKEIAPALDLGTFLINSVFVKILEEKAILNGTQIPSGDSDDTPLCGVGGKSQTISTSQANQRVCDSHTVTNSEAITVGIDRSKDSPASTPETVTKSQNTLGNAESIFPAIGEKRTTSDNHDTENAISDSGDESISNSNIANVDFHLVLNDCGTNTNSDIENVFLDSVCDRDTRVDVQSTNDNPSLIIPNITIVTHPGDQPPPCPICTKSFSEPCDLTKHMYTHMNDKPYKCATCKSGFDNSSELDSHDCSVNKSFKCSECLEAFFTLCALEAHIDKDHRIAKPYMCDYCNKVFCGASSLKVHRRLHTGERPFPCTYCDMKFIDSSARTVHLRKHTGERPFPCHFCDLKFIDSSSRRIHTRNHTGERPFQCQFCVKSFPTRTRLIVHVRTHTGERPYKCEVCGRGFYRKFVLTVHMRTHTGEKPYKCGHCEKSFTCSVDRRRHQEDIHEGRRLKCEVCGQEFKRAAFNRHVRVKHKEKSGPVMEEVENMNTA